MNVKHLTQFSALLASLVLTGCSGQSTSTNVPDAIAMTEEAVGHYCNMNILEHEGPKAQIHLKNIKFPIWFSQVRDAVAYTRLPEETFEIAAIYVHDMSKAASWAAPGDNAWIDINQAYFVINSNATGGMGAPETIPFDSMEGALAFKFENGGTIVKLDDIPDEYVLGPVDINHQTTGSVQ
ncbi:nitrous oxide reductase accessory protein NosL [Lentilitoribacter sp. Alg239-R112]|jgi:copper chaperone NosL|uniref:nitrous oxide reductase accessory protein NosL n=1 Tax=Lentilitoribacter sp. Alg239-R112 TaxID=2305987 RepID=UPI0013A6E40D|nr:nitrous oxide reductase accessory protein NosL [Lentilitoribacter sp. Alg239-R112]